MLYNINKFFKGFILKVLEKIELVAKIKEKIAKTKEENNQELVNKLEKLLKDILRSPDDLISI